jgi:hypothetical protein
LNTTTGAISNVSEITVAELYVTRSSATQFILGYTNTSNVNTDATTVNFSDTVVGAAIGFYVDLRSNGSLGSFDNLRILGSDETLLGETITVDGDVILDGQSALEFDVLQPGIGDVLSVGGNLHAGGTLKVALEGSAPSPDVNDVFDILDFATASGGFDEYDLPALPGGLAWSLSELLTNGELKVVNDVDLDNDGDVDGRDFLAIQRTDPSLIAAWQAQYGDQIAIPLQASLVAVPEPRWQLLLGVGQCLIVFRQFSPSRA